MIYLIFLYIIIFDVGNMKITQMVIKEIDGVKLNLKVKISLIGSEVVH